MDKKTFYITTPIYYVNAPPHLGHAYADVIADVFARYQRLLGKEVVFLTGTDEHGAKIVRAAEKSGKDAKEFVSEGREVFKNLARTLDVSNDDFISTSDEKRHYPAAEAIWRKMEEAGDIYKDVYKGLYCLGHEAFVTEKDLVKGRCPDHDEEPQPIEEENYFFRLSKYSGEIKKKIESGELSILPEGRKNEILALLDEGLKDVSFSRPSKDISWGVPVPGDATQTMYVWCDALSNYISALGYGSNNDEKFKKFWPADIHIIGKDILRFHAAIWPAMLMSARLKLPKTILVHGLIRVGDRKMSKTLGNVVNPFSLVETFGADALRYYFSRELSVFEDGDFTEERFREVYEANLSNGIGNYVSRVSAMIKNYCGGELKKPEESALVSVPLKKKTSLFLGPGKKENELEYFSIPYFIENVSLPKYHEAMKNYNIKLASDAAFELLGELDGYVQDYEPFKLVKTDPEKTKSVLWNLAYGAVFMAWMLSPMLPLTSEKIFSIFGVSDFFKEGWAEFKVREHKPLFPRKD